MVISVDDHPLSLNLLLFVRHAWSITPDVDIPVLIPAPNPGASEMPVSASSEEWADRWHIAWERAWDWYNIQEPDRMKHPTQELMRQVLRPGQELHPLIPPLRTTEYDWDGLDSAATEIRSKLTDSWLKDRVRCRRSFRNNLPGPEPSQAEVGGVFRGLGEQQELSQ
ncbi:hypothetical protein ACFRJ8_18915 [Arthrobacter sp. NPDC056886]|uniref:hypothetical protein n=1 Tax=Arthrobacter sp. NPDC056886 TaxID=3345960 RepID=UPI00367348FD